MEERYCQSCGMPMGSTDELYGTETDGSKSVDYCKYCYGGGAFLFQCSMDEMIDFCVKPMAEHNPRHDRGRRQGNDEAIFPAAQTLADAINLADAERDSYARKFALSSFESEV